MAREYRLGPARRIVNRIVTALLSVGAGPPSTYLMTTVGRRSGRPRTTPVTLVERDGVRWLVAPYGAVAWVLNLRAHPRLELRRGRRRETLVAAEVDGATAGPVLRRYAAAVPVTRPFFDAAPEDDDAAFAAEAHAHPVFLLSAHS